MARALNIALAGPRSYNGQMQELPWVNEKARKTINADDVDEAVRILWRSWNVAWIIIIVTSLV